MKFGIATAVYGRDRQVEIFLAGIDRLRRAGYAEIEVACAGDPDDSAMKLCADAGCYIVRAGNGFLSRKFQAAVDCLRGLNVDSVSLFGSDDLICNGLFAWLILGIQTGIEYLGVLDLYVYQLETGLLAYWPGYAADPLPGNTLRAAEPIGLARTYSRALLARMDWRLWDADYPTGIDWPAENRIGQFTPKSLIATLRASRFLALDIKASDKNIGTFSHYTSGVLKREETRSLLRSRLSREELDLMTASLAGVAR